MTGGTWWCWDRRRRNCSSPGGPALGEWILLNGSRFQVMGVAEKTGRGNNNGVNQSAYIPLSVMMEMFPHQGREPAAGCVERHPVSAAGAWRQRDRRGRCPSSDRRAPRLRLAQQGRLRRVGLDQEPADGGQDIRRDGRLSGQRGRGHAGAGRGGHREHHAGRGVGTYARDRAAQGAGRHQSQCGAAVPAGRALPDRHQRV